MTDEKATGERRIDAAALATVTRRLSRSTQAPWLHGEVARRMGERLSLIRLQPQRIIEWEAFWGAGDGPLRQAYPAAQRIAVEHTLEGETRSRQALRRALPWWRRWLPPRDLNERCVNLGPGEGRGVGDVSRLRAAQAELIWSNMKLHAERDPPAVLTQWQRLLAPNGFVMFACLGPGTFQSLRAVYRAHGWTTPTLDFVDMHDLGDMLIDAGFADPVMDQETLTLTFADAASALRELRSLGGNASPDRFQGLRTPRWRQRLEDAWPRADGRCTLDVEIVYGHAFKALPRARGVQETVVPLADMRAMVRSRRP